MIPIGLVLLALVFYKPTRIIILQAFGTTCLGDNICIDDPSRLDEARQIRNDAIEFVVRTLGDMNETPRFVFCSTLDCFSTFDNPEVAAMYYWGAGTILVNEIGWEPYIIRHELIHHWQNQNLGGVKAATGLPRWYIEGMAYVLSDDPRPVIPNQQAQEFRERFSAWLEAGNDWRLPPK